jgi:hypothetical protein
MSISGSSAVFDARAYYSTKAQSGYKGAVTGNAVAAAGKQVQWFNTFENKAVDGAFAGSSWLYKSACHAALKQAALDSVTDTLKDQYVCAFPRDQAATLCDNNGTTVGYRTCETGWCSGIPTLSDDPSTCSNSGSFQVFDSSSSSSSSSNDSDGTYVGASDAAFTSLVLASTNDVMVSAAFATAVVLVRPNYGSSGATASAFSQTTYPQSIYNYDTYRGYWTGSGQSVADRNAAEQDFGGLCIQTLSAKSASTVGAVPYTYGDSSAPTVTDENGLSASDSVLFAGCVLPQQLRAACTTPGTCCNVGKQNCTSTSLTSSSSSSLLAPTFDGSPTTETSMASCGQTRCYTALCKCASYSVDRARNENAQLFRPFSMYFTALVSSNTLIARDDPSITTDSDDDDDYCFFNGTVVSPETNNESLYAYEPSPYAYIGGDANPRYGVRVKFSLLSSADGTDPTTGSWLSQFLQPLTTLGLEASTYATQAGWSALKQFYVRLTNTLPLSNTVYQRFCKLYFAYAVTQRFLLQFYYLAPLASGDQSSTASYVHFCSQAEWTENVVNIWTRLSSDASETLSALTSSDLFLNLARPSLSSVDLTYNQVQVSIVVPALLAPYIANDQLGALLLRLFPRASENFNITSESFDVVSAFNAIASPQFEDNEEDDQVFEVVDGSVTTQAIYACVDSDEPGSTVTIKLIDDEVEAGSLKAPIAVKATFKIQLKQHKATLLFYLYYLFVTGAPITTMSNLVGASEPQIKLAPEVLNWSSACNLVQLKSCSITGFSGVGASRVNSLFVTSDHSACKCIAGSNLPLSLSNDKALYKPYSMCFNLSCNNSDSMVVHRQSLLANSNNSCPSGAIATAKVENGAITGLTFKDPGTNYLQGFTPTVKFSGSLGTGAVVTVKVPGNGGGLQLEKVIHGGSGYDADTTEVHFVIEESGLPSSNNSDSVDCSTQCSAYANVLSMYDDVDYSQVDVSALASTCGLEFSQDLPGLKAADAFVASSVLVVLAFPILMGVVALISRFQESSSNEASSATMQLTYMVGGLATVVCIGAVVYFWLSVRGGEQSCALGTVTSGGYLQPASVCMTKQLNLGFAQVPSFEVPQVFCSAPQSYCQCSKARASYCGSRAACGCNDASCCADNGICSSSALIASSEPYSGRQVKATPETHLWSWHDIVFASALFLFAAPCIVALFVGLVPEFDGKVPAALVCVLCCAVLCSTPVLLRLFDSAYSLKYRLQYAPCIALDEYPTTITVAFSSTGPSLAAPLVLTTSDAVDDDASAPTYTGNDDGLSTLQLVTDGTSKAWQLYTSSDGIKRTGSLVSEVVYAPASSSGVPVIYARFTSSSSSSSSSSNDSVYLCGATSSGRTSCSATL